MKCIIKQSYNFVFKKIWKNYKRYCKMTILAKTVAVETSKIIDT